MPELVYTKDNIPTPEEFRADLERAEAMANPVDDLLMLANRLWQFEQKYNMPSAEFYQKFLAGVLDDELQHCLNWFAVYDMYIDEKRALEAALMRAAIRPVDLENDPPIETPQVSVLPGEILPVLQPA